MVSSRSGAASSTRHSRVSPLFVHLNVHSEYSALEGGSSLEALCRAASKRGFHRLALTDTNNLYGAVNFQEIAKRNGLKPIFGAELRHQQKRALLLVKNRTGYGNLCRILSARHEDTGFDLMQTVTRFREGLILITDCAETINAWKRNSKEDLYVEITPGVNMAQSQRLCRSEQLPPVATNGVHFADAGDFSVYPVLQAIKMNTKLSRLSKTSRVLPQHWLAPARMIERHFPNLPQALENAARIAEACAFELEINRTIFPTSGGLRDGETFLKLQKKTYAGALRCYGAINAEIRRRLQHELKIIQQKSYAHYFLIVEQITGNTPISCGRGSGAASLVSYCLGITHVDPIKHKLRFERFLSTTRDDPPDIDIDLPWDERESVVQRVFSQYGKERVAMVANHNRLGLAGAIREVAKVYGVAAAEISHVLSRITKRQEIAWLSETPDSRAWVESLRTMELNEPWPEILSYASKIDGHFRHLSLHCGGVVIVPDEIRSRAPVQTSASGVPVLQWDKDQVEDAGMIKMDLLGNRSLSVIRDTLAAIEKNYGTVIDYRSWNPADDRTTQEIIKSGETIGCFNIESPAVRLLLKKLWLEMPPERKAQSDIFAYTAMVSSLVRPAAVSYTNEFIRRAQAADCGAPESSLRRILPESHGILLYQDDVTQVAMALAGFSLEKADQLRKALSHRRKAKKLKEYRQDFCGGALERGVSPALTENIWRMIVSFVGYSFCKAHSASYAQVSFKCAYLKAHYPVEFMAAVLSNEGGYYPTQAYVSEARRMGLKFMAPDINYSIWAYRARAEKEIRVGFMHIRGIKKQFIDKVLAEREARGRFRSFDDFYSRTDFDLAQARLLVKTGCFDETEPELSRPALLWRAHAQRERQDLSELPRPPDYSNEEKLTHEIECFGFLVSCHPLDLYRVDAAALDIIQAAALPNYIGRRVTLLGWLINEKLTQTRTGEAMEFVTFEDQTAIYEATFFPKTYRRLWHLITANGPLLISGIVEQEFGAVTLKVMQLNRLDVVRSRCYAENRDSKPARENFSAPVPAGEAHA